MDCAGRNGEHGYRESIECPSRRPASLPVWERLAHPNDLVKLQLGAAGRCVRLLGAAPSIGGSARPHRFFPLCLPPQSRIPAGRFTRTAYAKGALGGDPRQHPVGVVMKGLFKYCETQRMLRVLCHRWPYRRFHCRHDMHRVVCVTASRHRCRQGRSHSLPNLNDARHNRPHTYRTGDTDNGL